MNIFVVDIDPVVAARSLHDKHVVKMIVESAQILSTCHPQGSVKYRHTHYNHPSCVWARESLQNYEWLFAHALALCEEYTYRYGKIHSCQLIIRSLPAPDLPQIGLTSFAQAMPEEYRMDHPVDAYRNYYLDRKIGQSKWTRRMPPDWVEEKYLQLAA